jgi:hypothetical protein
VVVAIAQHADELGRERLVQHLQHLGAVARVALGDRTFLDVAARGIAQGLDVGELRLALRRGDGSVHGFSWWKGSGSAKEPRLPLERQTDDAAVGDVRISVSALADAGSLRRS